MIGIKLSPLNNEFKKQPLGPSKAIYYSIKEVWFVSVTSLKYLGKMLIGSADSSQLGGPIRIAKITGQGSRIWGSTLSEYNGLYFNQFGIGKFISNSYA